MNTGDAETTAPKIIRTDILICFVTEEHGPKHAFCLVREVREGEEPAFYVEHAPLKRTKIDDLPPPLADAVRRAATPLKSEEAGKA